MQKGIVCILGLTALLSGIWARAAEPDAAYFANLIEQRLATVSRGDGEAYLGLTHPELVHISETGTRRGFNDMTDFVNSSASTDQLKKSFKVSDAHVVVRNGFAFVDALVTETIVMLGKPIQGQFRESDVLVMKDGNWVFWRHHETLLPAKVEGIASNPANFESYVGRYEYWAGNVETIAAKDGHLWVTFQDPKESPAKLHALTDSTFFLEQDPSRMTFIRDDTGKVTGFELMSINGLVTVASKMP